MYELAILALLIVVIVLSIRGGKPVVQVPVIIHRPGQYHITLAPQLAYAQTFIEQIVLQFAQLHKPNGDIPGQYFEIRGPQAACYLLAIAMRGGVLYFQAINPQPSQRDGGNLEMLRDFSAAVIARLPLTEPLDGTGAESLRAAVDTVAGSSGIEAKVLV